MIRVLVCGGRSYSDAARVNEVLDGINAERQIVAIIEGGALGADRLARYWAQTHHVGLTTCQADWERHGKSAGPIRNRAMLGCDPHLVVAFAGGAGTRSMVALARAANVEILEIDAGGDGTGELGAQGVQSARDR